MAGKNYGMKVVLDAVDNITGPVNRIQKRLESMTGPLRKMNNRWQQFAENSGLNRVRSRLGAVGQGLRNVAGATQKVGARLGIMGGVASAVFGNMVYQTARSGEQILAWKNRLGIGAESLQELLYVGEQFNIQNQAMVDGLKELSIRADEFATTGKGPAAEAFRRLGLTPEQIAKVKGDTDKLFKMITNGMTGVQDQAKRQRLVDELFGGQAGEKMAELAGKSSEELQKQVEKARETGNVRSEEALKKGKGLMRTLKNLKETLEGLRNKVLTPLLPVLGNLAQRFTEWAQSNLDEISAWAKNFARSLPDRLRSLRDQVAGLLDNLTPLLQAARWLTDRFGTANVIMVAVAAVVGGPLITALASLTTAVISLGGALLATPIGWFGVLVVATVGAVAAAVYQIYQNWGPLADFFWDVMGDILSAVKWAWGWIKEAFSWTPMGMLVENWGPIQDYMTGVADRITKAFTEKFQAMQDVVSSIMGWISDKIRSVMDWVNSAISRVRSVASYMPGIDAPEPGQGAQPAGGTRAITNAEQGRVDREERSARVRVDFENLPEGARVRSETDAGMPLELGMGYSMSTP